MSCLVEAKPDTLYSFIVFPPFLLMYSFEFLICDSVHFVHPYVLLRFASSAESALFLAN